MILDVKKRIVAVSDFQCGNIRGLTPTEWQMPVYKEIASPFWDWFKNDIDKVKSERKIDCLVALGDLVDGEGKKETLNHLSTDIREQVKMACEIIEYIDCKETYIVRGTGYHVTGAHEYEDMVQENLDGSIKCGIHDTLRSKVVCDGEILTRIKWKHHASKSGVLNTPGLNLGRMRNGIIKDVSYGITPPNIEVRAHVHEKAVVQVAYGILILNPCLQLPGGSFGRRFDGAYDVGYSVIDIYGKGIVHVDQRILFIPELEHNEVEM